MYYLYNLILDLDNKKMNDREQLVRCLETWDDYCNLGLYGFALPPALYRLLRDDAQTHKVTISEELTMLLEVYYAESIADELESPTLEDGRTNLITTIEYGRIHGKRKENNREEKRP